MDLGVGRFKNFSKLTLNTKNHLEFPSFEKIKSLVLENSVKITRDININMLENWIAQDR